MALVQWNLNGYYSHLGELPYLIYNTSPYYICLQETRLKPNQDIKMKNYYSITKNRLANTIASGGVAIMIKENIHATEINLNTNLEAVAITTNVPEINKITICNLYLPPNQTILQQEIEHLIKQLPSPFLLLGDFNSHNILWGSKNTDSREKKIEKVIDKDNIILLNDSRPTHFCVQTGKFSNIDLTMCDANLAPNLTWDVYPDLIGNHFPLIISLS